MRSAPHRARLVAALACAMCLLVPARALADGEQDLARARVVWKTGKRLFHQGDYKGALARFDQGYALSGKGGFLFNMAECQRLLGDDGQAQVLYRRYLAAHPTGKSRGLAIKRLLALDAARAAARSPGPGADTPAPGAAQPAKPKPAPIVPAEDPAPKPRTVAPAEEPTPDTAQGAPAALPASATQAQRSRQPATSRTLTTARAAQPEAKQPGTPIYKRWWFWTIIGAVAVGGGVTAGVLASQPGLPAHDYQIDLR